jgi:hypothetical protein
MQVIGVACGVSCYDGGAGRFIGDRWRGSDGRCAALSATLSSIRG